ncbi:B-cell differentiation antigen CD72-like [Ochotona curzoniae]|uniref:B-cell differentiation antigen CD72-like n=1 Tax=Ochotona curzoniae TaxID=130825 RepID=UPI001B34DBAF|nr:B-cell differentiation antigen CD72-like [Ochotona curzoniae]
MAEAITYAELRFVKAPLRKNVSNTGQDSDEDGEVTYENVQVPSAPEAPAGLTLPSGAGDQTVVQIEQQPATSWSNTASPTTKRIYLCHGHPCCSQHLLLVLLPTCLLLGVAAICLGVRYQQVSQQFGQLSMQLETTNNSLQEQLHFGTVQLQHMEKDLLDSKEELAQRQKTLEGELKAHQAAHEQLQLCQADREKMQETLQKEEAQKQTMQQMLSHLQGTLRPFFTCPSQDTCCMVGWRLIQRRCFYISLTKRDWQESQKYCKSLSSNLTTIRDTWSSYSESSPWKGLLSELSQDTPYWTGHSLIKDQWWSSSWCSAIEQSYYSSLWYQKTKECSSSFPCICEMASFRFPDGDYSLQNSGVHA